MPRSSVIVRIDGKAFHTFTKGCEKPFDHGVMSSMIEAAKDTFVEMQSAKLAYIQSDEASFWLTDFDDLETEGWFNYNQSKIVSISASLFTLFFYQNADNYGLCNKNLPFFDSRAFNVPNDEVANYFLWRAKDWERNSLQMYCRSFFSHKELNNKKRADMHEMLHEIDKNWTNDLSNLEKNGTFLWKKDRELVESYEILPHFNDINNIVQLLMPDPNERKEQAPTTLV